MIKLDIISDPICPWCYIGKAQLDKGIALAGQNPFDMDWRVFQLNPDMPPGGMDRKAYLEAKFGGPDGAKSVYSRIEQAASDAGISVNFDRIQRTPNTMDAHRVIRWSATTGAQTALVTLLFQRYFEDGADIGDHGVLLDAVEAVGMEREVVARLLEGDADHAKLVEEDQTARSMGVTGVPCFVIAGKYVLQGAQPSETWAQVISELTSSQTTQENASV